MTVTVNRAEALARLDVLVGEWTLEARFPADRATPPPPTEGGPDVRSRFEWALDRQFLLQHTEIPIPGAPDSLTIISTDLESGAYTQHYYDSRGVVRLYAMTLTDRVWTLTRESPDFTPLVFRQRFTGTFSEDARTIEGAWEKCQDGDTWERDFTLIYHKVS
ncbi:hypothetical protein ACFYPC_26100 [Streptomyces sp. NPDC005808]|uniref:hypothetical protein n=1 Tax=Streptomyces sp. NPDC005808 TaxID=3364734 RepID=UPI003673715C